MFVKLTFDARYIDGTRCIMDIIKCCKNIAWTGEMLSESLDTIITAKASGETLSFTCFDIHKAECLEKIIEFCRKVATKAKTSDEATVAIGYKL